MIIPHQDTQVIEATSNVLTYRCTVFFWLKMWTKTGEIQIEIAALLSNWELIVNKTLQYLTFKLKLHFVVIPLVFLSWAKKPNEWLEWNTWRSLRTPSPLPRFLKFTLCTLS